MLGVLKKTSDDEQKKRAKVIYKKSNRKKSTEVAICSNKFGQRALVKLLKNTWKWASATILHQHGAFCLSHQSA